MLRSFSVIVPVLDLRDLVDRTLDSILASLDHLAAHHPRGDAIAGEVVVVDDGSTDGTPEVVRRRALSEPRLRLVRHAARRGIGAARNTGVRHASGDVLFFCDGDDLFLPEHVLLGFAVLDHAASGIGREAGPSLLRLGSRGHLVVAAGAPIAAVRTGVIVREEIHPAWRERIRRALAQCLCVRRECHEWCGGFPEDEVYVRLGGYEDVAYNRMLELFFRVGEASPETVEYVRRPGNCLDRRIGTLRLPPDSGAWPLTPSEEELHRMRWELESDRLDRLLAAWCASGPPPLPPAMLHLENVAALLARRDRTNDVSRDAAPAAVGRIPSGKRSTSSWILPSPSCR